MSEPVGYARRAGQGSGSRFLEAIPDFQPTPPHGGRYSDQAHGIEPIRSLMWITMLALIDALAGCCRSKGHKASRLDTVCDTVRLD